MHLHVARRMITLPDSRSHPPAPAHRLALWSIGFRPFYLFASVFAVVAISCWVAQFAGWTGSHMIVAGPYWHAHEMLFGYAFAVITGFLFTAVRNWANEPTPTGWLLASIAGLWLAGRVLVLTPWPLYAAVTDTAFALAVAAGIAVPLLRSGNRRNYFFVALIVALGAVNLGFYLAMADRIHIAAERGLRAGVDLILFLMVVMGGRVIPMFTANAVRGAKPLRFRWLERAALGSVLALLAADLLDLPAVVIGVVAGMGTLAQGARLALWQPWLTRRRPILWILHASYAWIAVYLAMRALAAVDLVPVSLAIHALTVGAIGGLTVGMMTRTARGHTGRPLEAGPLETACYALVQFAAIVRVFVPLIVPQWYVGAVVASGALWAAAFTLLVAKLGPMLLKPRIDGRSG
jgi:uncharacterized protein involved in response to NO